jgi:hypothetical protein
MKLGRLVEGTLNVGCTVSRQILHCLGGQWVRLGRAPCPVCGGASAVEGCEGLGCEDDEDEDVSCEGSFLGASSGQYQPGIAWNPEEADMM